MYVNKHMQFKLPLSEKMASSLDWHEFLICLLLCIWKVVPLLSWWLRFLFEGKLSPSTWYHRLQLYLTFVDHRTIACVGAQLSFQCDWCHLWDVPFGTVLWCMGYAGCGFWFMLYMVTTPFSMEYNLLHVILLCCHFILASYNAALSSSLTFICHLWLCLL